ncbi:MAG: carboxypeptidase-like regulatory domain-containing protein [Bacteroidota bacterium]
MSKPIFLLILILSLQSLIAQKKYNKLWAEVEKYELEGKFKNAAETTDKILKRAERSNEKAQLIKSFIYKSKFALLLEEDAQQKIVSEIRTYINKSDFPTNAILQSVYAGFLEQYLSQNQYKIRNRTQTSNSGSSDNFEVWDINALVAKIGHLYQESVSDEIRLKQILIDDYEAILTDSRTSSKYRPTLFDFLVHRSLDFYKIDRVYTNRLKERFLLNNRMLFEPTKVFSSEKFYTLDSVYSNRNAVKYFQKLESFHQNKDTLAYIDIVLQRMKFMKNNALGTDKDSLYFKALKKLRAEYKKHETSAVIDYEIANFLFETSKEQNAKHSIKLKSKRIEAFEICENAIMNYPNSDGGLLCKILKNTIEQKKLNIETEKNILPQKPFLAKVEFRNVDSLYISIYRIPFDYFEDSYSYVRDSLSLEILQTKKPIASKFFSLQKKADFYRYTTEIDLPALSIGHYMIVASSIKNVQDLNEIYTSDVVNITNLALLSSQTDEQLNLKFLNRQNGKPIPNAKITVTDGEKLNKQGKTNSFGEYHIKRSKKEVYDLRIVASIKGDTLLHSDYSLYRTYRNKKDDEHIAKLYLFMDRSIYRPGQTLYFKGMLIEKKKGISKVVPNTYVSVSIEDANGEDLKIFRLRTNQYGSVNGEFKIPKNSMTGEFYIYIDEDEGDEDGRYDRYWDKVDDMDYTEIAFSVEEYKRPKFEISFDDITENLLVGDSVSVPGSAKAFLGSDISNAKVSYAVERNTISLSNSYYYRGDKQMVAQGETETNGQGKFTIPFFAIPDSTLTKENRPVFSYNVSVDVTDINGETRTEEKTIYIGYHNLKTQITVPQKLNTEEENSIRVATNNLNDQPIEAQVKLKVFKIDEPERTLRKKPWSVVELQSISKDRYLELFPNEPYNSADVKENWPRGAKVVQKNFNTEGDDKIALGDISDWQSGLYKIEVTAIDRRKDTVSTSTSFEVFNPSDNYLPNNKIFNYELVNSEFKKDGFILLKFKTSTEELHVFMEGYYGDKEVFKELVHITDGNSLVKVPVENYYKDKLVFNFYYTKFNSLHSDQFAVNFPEVEKVLSIETLSFRNKLIPDSKENWSFRITDSNRENAQVEVLAAMYDTSLDQFREHSWNQDIGFRNYNYSSAPYIQNMGSFETNRFRPFNYIGKRNILPFLKNYHQLNWFGMNFGRISYNNKKYLRNLSQRVQQPQKIDGNISGIVADQNGLPLPGVNVVVKGTTYGTQTDFEGFYAINAPAGSELIFSYIGQKNEQVAIKKSGSVNIVMTEDAQALDEVVITAMGIKREKKSLGYAVSYVNAQSIYLDIEQQLQGKVAGVNITQSAGTPGTGSKVIIRGLNSFSNDNRTLFVIDGVPMQFEDGVSSEVTLLPENIADIQVLKDSAATAIYGSRGANGVVIITTKKGLEDALQVEPRSNLKETAFFFPNLTTDSKGTVSFNFSSPQALTKWKFMLLAHTKDLELGGLEKTVITQKDLSVVPNSPRFLREKDSIVFSVKLNNLTTNPLSGTSVLQLFDAITMQPISEKMIKSSQTINFNLAPQANTEISWQLLIPEGIQAIEYKILAKAGQQSDGEANILPVLSNRILVTEAQPLCVAPGKSKEVEFKKLLSNNSKSLKNHKFTIEYTSNPAWLAIKSLPYLMEFPHECSEQTFSRFYANALAESIIKNNPQVEDVFNSWKANGTDESNLEKNDDLKSILLSETPWVKDAMKEKENKALLANLFESEKVQDQQNQSLNKLKELQLSSGGFPWFAGGRESEFITRHIVAGFGHLNKLNIQNESDYKAKPIVKKALEYIDKEFIKDHKNQFEKASDTANIILSNKIIHYLYARSFFLESHPISKKIKAVSQKYLIESQKSWLTQSLYNKGMMVLFLNRMSEKETALKILEAIEEQAVNSEENGMYWKENVAGWNWYRAPIETQALLIEAFTEMEANTKTIDKLKLWLLKNKHTNQWATTKATTEAIYALLMNGSNWLSVSDNTIIEIGDERIRSEKLESTQKEAGTGYLKIDWSEGEITPNMAAIQVSNKSDVSGFGGVYWQYFEDLDKVSTSENTPLQIKKDIFVRTKSENGEKLVPANTNPISVGDVVTIRMKIITSADMEFVHLKDLRASGLEPIDVLSEYKWQDGLGYYQSTKDVATHFFFDRLPKGTYVFEYDLRANNRGDFSNGITTIQSMYAPEFTNRSKGVRLTID